MNTILKKWKAAADNNKTLEVIDVMLSGIAQMTLNYHPVCGSLLIIAAFMASPMQGISCIWSVLIATLLVYAMGIPLHHAREGLYTINPALVGMAVPMVTYQLEWSALPQVLVYSAIGSILSVLITAALRRILSEYQVTPLAIPYSLALVLVSGSTYYMTNMSPNPLFKPAVVELLTNNSSAWTVQSFAEAVLNAIAQVIWLEEVPLTPIAGIIVLVGICCASRIDAIMAVLLGTLATAFAIIIGVGQGGIMLGLHGYSAILLGFVIFGRAYKMSVSCFIMTVILSMLTVPFTLGLKPLMAVIGAPVAGLTFSLISVMAMLARPYFSKLIYNEPKIWTVPEDCGRISNTNVEQG